jgi:hypothetical protein
LRDLYVAALTARDQAHKDAKQGWGSRIERAARHRAKALANEALVHARDVYWRHVNAHGCRAG